MVDFTNPINTDNSAFLLKRPGEGQKIVRIFLPYDISVWTVIFVSVAIVGLLLFLIRFCLTDYVTRGEAGITRSFTDTVGFVADNLWLAYGTHLEQSK